MAQRISEQVVEWLTAGGDKYTPQTDVPLWVKGRTILGNNSQSNKSGTSDSNQTIINGTLTINPYYNTNSTNSSYQGLRLNRNANGVAQFIMGGDKDSLNDHAIDVWYIATKITPTNAANSSAVTASTFLIAQNATEIGVATPSLEISNLGTSISKGLGLYNSSPSTGYGLSLKGGPQSGLPTAGIAYTGTDSKTHGLVTGSWATYFNIENTSTYGWIFRRGTTNVASIGGNGDATFDGKINKLRISVGGSGFDPNDKRTESGIWIVKAALTANQATTGHGTLIGMGSNDIGTASQLWIPDSNGTYIYKRGYNNSNSTWGNWTKLSAGYSDTTGAFKDEQTITLTNDVVGSANGTAGWSISTQGKKMTPTELTNQDLNDYKTTKKTIFYYGAGSNNVVNNPANSTATPAANAGLQFGMYTYASAGGYVTQELVSTTGSANTSKWMRTWNGSSWTSWDQFITASNYETIMTNEGSSIADSGTASRIAYYNTANLIKSGSVTTDGGYLGNVSYLSINTGHQTNYRFLVTGNSRFNGTVTSNNMINATKNDTAEAIVRSDNSNGSVELLASTNRGLYDRTKAQWIVYGTQDGTKTYIPRWASKGSATNPVYFSSSGEPVGCTYSLNATVNSGTASRIAYYSGANAISSGSITTDGGYLGSVSYLSVNTAHQTNYRLYVNGPTRIVGLLDLNSDLNLYTGSDDSPDIVWWYGNKNKEQARIWMGSGSTTKWAPLYRCYNSDGTQLYSGNLVLGDGTGASGTWSISISGNAATASMPLGFSSNSQSSAGWGNQTGTGVTTWNDSSGGSIEFRKDNPSSGKLSIKVDGRFYGNEGNKPAMLMTNANNYWGMGDPDGNDTVWVRTTNQGIIPYQSGGVMEGHQYLGTSSWYFGNSYITRMYTHQVIVQGTVPSATMNAGEDHPRITFQENTGTQPVHLMYSDYDTYRAPAGLKIVGGGTAESPGYPAWLEVEGNIYIGTPTSTGRGIYWNPYVESTTDNSDAAGIWQIKAGVAGGTELRISQLNDSADVINICSPYYIYLNSKKAFTINDSWLRINDGGGFTSGIFCGSSIVRTDGQLQVGASGAYFYANNSGNGYFSNTLGIHGTNTNYNLYVNGTSLLNGNTRVYGYLEIGRDDAAASTGYATANVGANNYITFYGVYGDGAGGYNHTYISERIWGAKSTANEQSELFLFHGNDGGNGTDGITASGAGPDRIRLAAAAHVFQTYSTATSGGLEAVATSANLHTRFQIADSRVTVNDIPTYLNRGATNAASIYWNKAGDNWGGIGYGIASGTNYFCGTDGSGAWRDSGVDYWRFRGTLEVVPGWNNYRDGIRIYQVGGWSSITFGGNDLAVTTQTGITANSWFIGNSNSDTTNAFYITRNGSPSSGTDATRSEFSSVNNQWRLRSYVQTHKAGVYRSGLHIYGPTYGNDASNMVSGLTGVFRWNDGGPQITFDTSGTPGGSQSGALIFTDHDLAGTGTSFHFVSNQNSNDYGGDTTVTAPRFRARRCLTVNANSDLANDTYRLYVVGQSYYTGQIVSSYKSGTWVNSLTNSAIIIEDAASSYGGWICGPTKDGRIAISTYQSADNYIYLGYGERGRTNNSFSQAIKWDGPNNILYGARSDWTWLRVVNDSSNNSDDAMVYFQNRTSNDWATRIDITGVNYGLYIIGTGTDMLRVGTNSVLRVDESIIRCNRKIEIWPNLGNYQEGIRIHPCGGWSTIVLGGTDLTAESGTSANSWSLHAASGNFYLTRNGSSGTTTGASLQCVNNTWYIYTGTNGYKLVVDGNHTTVMSRSTGADAFGQCGLEIRENQLVTNGQSSRDYAPKLGFHWSQRCAGFISLDSDNIFYFVNQSNNGYKPMVSGNHYIKQGSPHLYLDHTGITKGTNPSAWNYSAIEFRDSALSRTALIENGIGTAGENYLNIWVTAYTSGSTNWSGIRLYKTTGNVLTCYIAGTTDVSGDIYGNAIIGRSEVSFISSSAGSPWPYIRFDSRAGGTTYTTVNQSTWAQIYCQIPAKRASDSYYYGTRFFFREYSKTANTQTRLGYYEDFYLPMANDGRTSSVGYDILTTKNHAAPSTGTANRLAYYSAAGTISSTAIVTNDGTHVTFPGQVYINFDQDVGLNQNGSLIVGTKSSTNIAVDANEIMARNNSAASQLNLNIEGGLVYIGSGGLDVAARIRATNGYVYASTYVQAAAHMYMDTGHFHIKYNGTWYRTIQNHNNGNMSFNASSGGLYIGYENTTLMNWLNGKMTLTLDSSSNPILTLTSGGYIKIGSTAYGNGFIELYNSGNPYIDFHRSNTSNDFSTRICNWAQAMRSGTHDVLELKSSLEGTGVVMISGCLCLVGDRNYGTAAPSDGWGQNRDGRVYFRIVT